MSAEVVSIWIELKLSHSNNLLIGGFYRVWNHEVDKTDEGQEKRNGRIYQSN